MKLLSGREPARESKTMKKSLIVLAITALIASVPMFAGQNPPADPAPQKSSKPKKAKKPSKKSKKDKTTPPAEK